jgi:preprotein translocase subunit SecG
VTALIVLLYVVHILVSIFLVLVVLLQQGKGADLSVFGGGSTQAAFGARGAATLLHKLTVGGFVIFTLTTLTIAIFQGHRGSGTVMGSVPAAEEEPAAPATPPEGEAGSPPPAGEGQPQSAPAPADDPAAGDGGQAPTEEPPAQETPAGASLPDASSDSP